MFSFQDRMFISEGCRLREAAQQIVPGWNFGRVCWGLLVDVLFFFCAVLAINFWPYYFVGSHWRIIDVIEVTMFRSVYYVTMYDHFYDYWSGLRPFNSWKWVTFCFTWGCGYTPHVSQISDHRYISLLCWSSEELVNGGPSGFPQAFGRRESGEVWHQNHLGHRKCQV